VEPTDNQALRLAEEKYRADKLIEAEPLYLQALKVNDANQRRHCYDQLLIICARLGRADRSIVFGLAYRKLLNDREDGPRLRLLQVELGRCYLALGRPLDCEPLFEEALAAVRGLPPLANALQLSILVGLARAAELNGDLDKARDPWQRVEAFARAWDADTDRPPTERERIDLVGALAASYRFQQQPAQAVEQLERLLKRHDQLNDLPGKCQTLRLLAGQHAAGGNEKAAEQCLRQALELSEKSKPSDRLLQGDLASDLGDVLQRTKRPDDANRMYLLAIAHYQAVLPEAPLGTSPGAGPQTGTGLTVAAFWKLQHLYQAISKYQKALKLTQDQSYQWSGSPLLAPKLKSEQGSLQVIMGAYARGRTLLREAAADLETQVPLNLIELPRALNNLALAEQATSEMLEAEKISTRCLKLYADNKLPDDLIRAETLNLLGTCAALRGDYV